MNKRLLALTIASFLPTALACEDDPVAPPPPSKGYMSLTQRESVLNNLELAYIRRHVDKYNEIVDESFTMYFWAGDVTGGKTPDLWGRPDEVAANRNLFDDNYIDQDPSNGIQPRCTKISMDVKWEDGVQWVEVEPLSDPSEKWYVTTLFCNFQFDVVPDLHLVNNQGYKVQFTVRNAGPADAPRWQLVEMRDLGNPTPSLAVTHATEPSTLGSVKALYH